MNTYNVAVTVNLNSGKIVNLLYKGLEARSESEACAEARYFFEEHPLYAECLKAYFEVVA